MNWLLLAVLGGVGWLVFSPAVGQAVCIGGLIANVSFWFLKRDLLSLLAGTLEAVKVRFFLKYYARLSVLVLLLFLLIKYQGIHTIGLLVGLSTVFASIVLALVGEMRKIFANANLKEAS